eukprot:GHVL01030774.1.p1 GENE.GHVL01030774.1~~GHVL01030774.1.p1  ORF type:complete len:1097 (+),score=285.55 GHVL01030774.1:171-3461(+)
MTDWNSLTVQMLRRQLTANDVPLPTSNVRKAELILLCKQHIDGKSKRQDSLNGSESESNTSTSNLSTNKSRNANRTPSKRQDSVNGSESESNTSTNLSTNKSRISNRTPKGRVTRQRSRNINETAETDEINTEEPPSVMTQRKQKLKRDNSIDSESDSSNNISTTTPRAKDNISTSHTNFTMSTLKESSKTRSKVVEYRKSPAPAAFKTGTRNLKSPVAEHSSQDETDSDDETENETENDSETDNIYSRKDQPQVSNRVEATTLSSPKLKSKQDENNTYMSPSAAQHIPIDNSKTPLGRTTQQPPKSTGRNFGGMALPVTPRGPDGKEIVWNLPVEPIIPKTEVPVRKVDVTPQRSHPFRLFARTTPKNNEKNESESSSSVSSDKNVLSDDSSDNEEIINEPPTIDKNNSRIDDKNDNSSDSTPVSSTSRSSRSCEASNLQEKEDSDEISPTQISPTKDESFTFVATQDAIDVSFSNDIQDNIDNNIYYKENDITFDTQPMESYMKIDKNNITFDVYDEMESKIDNITNSPVGEVSFDGSFSAPVNNIHYKNNHINNNNIPNKNNHIINNNIPNKNNHIEDDIPYGHITYPDNMNEVSFDGGSFGEYLIPESPQKITKTPQNISKTPQNITKTPNSTTTNSQSISNNTSFQQEFTNNHIYKENNNIYKENNNIYKENNNIYKENNNLSHKPPNFGQISPDKSYIDSPSSHIHAPVNQSSKNTTPSNRTSQHSETISNKHETIKNSKKNNGKSYSLIAAAVIAIVSILIISVFRSSSNGTSNMFCDTKSDIISIDNSIDIISMNTCVPCPDYASCERGEITSCPIQFILKRGKQCVPDSRMMNLVQSILDEMTYKLRKIKGESECYRTDYMMSKNKMRNYIKSQFSHVDDDKMENAYISAWTKALNNDISAEYKLEVSGIGLGEESVIHSLTSRLPFSCMITRLLWKILPLTLIPIFIAMGFLQYCRAQKRRLAIRRFLVDSITMKTSWFANCRADGPRLSDLVEDARIALVQYRSWLTPERVKKIAEEIVKTDAHVQRGRDVNEGDYYWSTKNPPKSAPNTPRTPRTPAQTASVQSGETPGQQRTPPLLRQGFNWA